MTAPAAAQAYQFPSDIKSSIAHWWSSPSNAGEVAEAGLVKRGLGSIPLLSPQDAAASTVSDKIAVFRDVPVTPPPKARSSERKRWYIHMLEVGKPQKEAGETTTVVTHGYGNGLGFYFQNIQALTSQPNNRTLILDWLGMGRSGRPNFPRISTCDESPEGVAKRVEQAEAFFVDSLEELREKLGVEKMVLVGHSIGGYLSSAYALKHPTRVSKLVLISPVGVPLSPYAPPKPKHSKSATTPPKTQQEETSDIVSVLEQDMFPSGDYREERSDLPSAPKTWWTYLWERNYSPFGVLRSVTFMGPSLLSRYASRRFATFPEQVQSELFSYLYDISTARGSGEYCLAHILAPGAYARAPLLNRLQKLDIPITFIYGDHDWMDEKGGYDMVKKLQAKSGNETQKRDSKVLINPHSGHWVHLENPGGFNKIIERELRVAQ